MTTQSASTNSKMYAKLIAHFNKQYRNVMSIQTVYIQDNKVYAGDYTTTSGVTSIASDSAMADKVINFI